MDFDSKPWKYQTFIELRIAPGVWLPFVACKRESHAAIDRQDARKTPGCTNVKTVVNEDYYIGAHCDLSRT